MPLYTYEFNNQDNKRIDLVRSQEDRGIPPSENEIREFIKLNKGRDLQWEDGMGDPKNWQKIMTSQSNRWYYCDDLSKKYR